MREPDRIIRLKTVLARTGQSLAACAATRTMTRPEAYPASRRSIGDTR